MTRGDRLFVIGLVFIVISIMLSLGDEGIWANISGIIAVISFTAMLILDGKENQSE